MLSRIISAILLVLAGAVIGAIGTIAHRIHGAPGGSTSRSGLDRPRSRRSPRCSSACVCSATAASRPSLAALGAIAVILLFSQQSAGGSVLIPNNLAGQVWLVGPILIAAIVLAWPDVQPRRRSASRRHKLDRVALAKGNPNHCDLCHRSPVRRCERPGLHRRMPRRLHLRGRTVARTSTPTSASTAAPASRSARSRRSTTKTTCPRSGPTTTRPTWSSSTTSARPAAPPRSA